jgi:hypothetical protein
MTKQGTVRNESVSCVPFQTDSSIFYNIFLCFSYRVAILSYGCQLVCCISAVHGLLDFGTPTSYWYANHCLVVRGLNEERWEYKEG